MPQNLTDGKSTLVQVMAWCLTASVDPDLSRHMVSLGLSKLKKGFCRHLPLVIDTSLLHVKLNFYILWHDMFVFISNFQSQARIIFQNHFVYIDTIRYIHHESPGIILCMQPANERRRYSVT